MPTAKDSLRSKVRVGYDRKVYKTFRGNEAKERFENEVRVLEVLEARGCGFVPRLLSYDEGSLTIVTSNCGRPVDRMSEDKMESIYRELEEVYGVVHDDPFLRNITYSQELGRFCVIDFELAQVLPIGNEVSQKLLLSWYGLSRSGRQKPVNDDNLAVFRSEVGWGREMELEGRQELNLEGIVFAVSDGMGGRKGGDIASRLVVNELRRFLPGRMGEFRDQADPASILGSAVADLHQYVLRYGKAHKEWEGLGATLVAGLFYRTQFWFAHVGDSRLYRFRKGGLEQLTWDHSLVGRSLRLGEISEREARMHPARHRLNRIIGGDAPAVEPQLGSLSLERGDYFLFCTDGLTDGLWDKNITSAFLAAAAAQQGPRELAEGLVERAMSAAGRDDTTVFVLRVD